MPIRRLRCARIDSPCTIGTASASSSLPAAIGLHGVVRRTSGAPAAASLWRSRRASSRRRGRRRSRAPAADRRSTRRARLRTRASPARPRRGARSNARTRKRLRRLRSRRTWRTKLPSGESAASALLQSTLSTLSTAARRRPRVRCARGRASPGPPRETTADDERFQIGGDGRMLDAHRQTRRRRGRARGRRRVEPDAARVQGGAAGDDGHRIDAGGDAAAEQVADAGAQPRHQRRAADQHHARDLVCRALVLGQQVAHGGQAAGDERLRQRVQLVARDLELVRRRRRRRRARRSSRVGARQLDLRLLAGDPQPRQRAPAARGRAIDRRSRRDAPAPRPPTRTAAPSMSLPPRKLSPE